MTSSAVVRIALLFLVGAASSGCGEATVHTQFAQLQESPEGRDKVKRIGSFSRVDLLAGESPPEEALMLDVGVVRGDARGANQLCFRIEEKGLEGRTFSNDPEFRKSFEASIKSLSYAIRSHDSDADFREGAPWPSANVKSEDVKVAGVDLLREKQKYRENGSKKYRSSSRDVQWEVCAPLPPLTEATKFISFSVLKKKPSDNRIAIWSVRP